MAPVKMVGFVMAKKTNLWKFNYLKGVPYLQLLVFLAMNVILNHYMGHEQHNHRCIKNLVNKQLELKIHESTTYLHRYPKQNTL